MTKKQNDCLYYITYTHKQPHFTIPSSNTLLMNETCISLPSHPLSFCNPWNAHLYWWLYKFWPTSHWTKKQSNHRGNNVSPMNPEADLSLWHVNLYGNELKLLLLLVWYNLHTYSKSPDESLLVPLFVLGQTWANWATTFSCPGENTHRWGCMIQ
jgi:hypothetical protein